MPSRVPVKQKPGSNIESRLRGLEEAFLQFADPTAKFVANFQDLSAKVSNMIDRVAVLEQKFTDLNNAAKEAIKYDNEIRTISNKRT